MGRLTEGWFTARLFEEALGEALAAYDLDVIPQYVVRRPSKRHYRLDLAVPPSLGIELTHWWTPWCYHREVGVERIEWLVLSNWNIVTVGGHFWDGWRDPLIPEAAAAVVVFSQLVAQGLCAPYMHLDCWPRSGVRIAARGQIDGGRLVITQTDPAGA